MIKRKKKRKIRTKEEKENFLKSKALTLNSKKTWPELEFEKLLNELNVDFQTQEIVGGKIFDFYIPLFNLLIEVHGDYWHGNPKKYSKLNRTQNKNVKNDAKKMLIAQENGYKLSIVWESDLKENYILEKGRIKKILQ